MLVNEFARCSPFRSADQRAGVAAFKRYVKVVDFFRAEEFTGARLGFAPDGVFAHFFEDAFATNARLAKFYGTWEPFVLAGVRAARFLALRIRVVTVVTRFVFFLLYAAPQFGGGG